MAGFDPYIGEITMVGFNFCPRGTASTNGQLLAISQNSALFSLLGTQYGGDGRTTFALPDLRGRVPIHNGTGPGLSNYSIGQLGGTETNTMTLAQMPLHNHAVKLMAEGAAGNTANPTNNMISISTNGDRVFGPDTAAAEVAMNPKAIMESNAGGSLPQNNIQPYLAVNFCIATVGVFPSRN
ncbi:MAG: tail fiber protein [Pontixanthobacter sp.]